MRRVLQICLSRRWWCSCRRSGGLLLLELLLLLLLWRRLGNRVLRTVAVLAQATEAGHPQWRLMTWVELRRFIFGADDPI